MSEQLRLNATERELLSRSVSSPMLSVELASESSPVRTVERIVANRVNAQLAALAESVAYADELGEDLRATETEAARLNTIVHQVEKVRRTLAPHAERGFYMGDDRPQSHVAVAYVIGLLDSALAEADQA